MCTEGLFWIWCLHFLQKKVISNRGGTPLFSCFPHVTNNQFNIEHTVKDILIFLLRNMKTQNFHSPQFLQETRTDASSLSSFQKSASSANQRKLEHSGVITLHSITIALTYFLASCKSSKYRKHSQFCFRSTPKKILLLNYLSIQSTDTALCKKDFSYSCVFQALENLIDVFLYIRKLIEHAEKVVNLSLLHSPPTDGKPFIKDSNDMKRKENQLLLLPASLSSSLYNCLSFKFDSLIYWDQVTPLHVSCSGSFLAATMDSHLFWFFCEEKALIKFTFSEDTTNNSNSTIICCTVILSPLLQQLILPCHVFCKCIIAQPENKNKRKWTCKHQILCCFSSLSLKSTGKAFQPKIESTEFQGIHITIAILALNTNFTIHQWHSQLPLVFTQPSLTSRKWQSIFIENEDTFQFIHKQVLWLFPTNLSVDRHSEPCYGLAREN